MERYPGHIIKKALPAIALVIFTGACFACAVKTDLSGTFRLNTGDCQSKYIILKKVLGFGDKYYLVTIYKKDLSPDNGREFLGVIKGNIITIYSGSRLHQKNLTVEGKIIIKGESLQVVASEKECRYIKVE